MKIISTGYNKTSGFDNPKDWLERISFYTGVYDALAKRHELISIERINYEGTCQQNGVRYYFMRLKKSVVFFPWRMHRFIKKQRPDVVLVHSFIFPLQIIQLRWTLGKKVKIIVQNHAERPAGRMRQFLQRMADPCINAYFFTSADMGNEWIEKGIIAGPEKIIEVMEVSSTLAKKKEEVAMTKKSGTPVFLWVGRLNANKDPITVIKAFTRFLSNQPSAKLYMVYQTEELLQQVKQLIHLNNGAKEAIELVGRIPNEQLYEWYKSADFFISGSHYESGGVAVCEAMSCGCIPVITDILSFRKMTGFGRCGLLYEPGNDKALLNALLQTTKMDRGKEQGKVLRQFNEELSFEAIAAKIEKVTGS